MRWRFSPRRASQARIASSSWAISDSSCWTSRFEGLGLREDASGLLAASEWICGFERVELLGEPPPIGQADLRAQLLQPVGLLLVAAGLGGLQPHALEAVLDLVDDVGQPQQVLVDALQPAQRLDLLGLEAADAGRLLEDGPAVARRGLQQDIDLALLDDAVGVACRRRCRGTGP